MNKPYIRLIVNYSFSFDTEPRVYRFRSNTTKMYFFNPTPGKFDKTIIKLVTHNYPRIKTKPIHIKSPKIRTTRRLNIQ